MPSRDAVHRIDYCAKQTPDVRCRFHARFFILKGTGLMKVAILIFCGLAFGALAGAQTNGPSGKGGSQNVARPNADVVPLPSIKLLTPAQAAGKKLFVQRCSVCHLPALPSYTAYGPLLDKNLVEDRGEETERTKIVQGSLRMPGFQYTLGAAEIDEIVDYLKTVELPKKD
jgi:mono/diheme cytochrome c family protein